MKLISLIDTQNRPSIDHQLPNIILIQTKAALHISLQVAQVSYPSHLLIIRLDSQETVYNKII